MPKDPIKQIAKGVTGTVASLGQDVTNAVNDLVNQAPDLPTPGNLQLPDLPGSGSRQAPPLIPSVKDLARAAQKGPVAGPFEKKKKEPAGF